MNPIPPKHAPIDSPPCTRLDKQSQVYHPLNTILLKLTSDGDDFFLNGLRVDLVKLVCRVTEMTVNGTRIDLTLVDEYGTFRGVVYTAGQEAPKVLRGYVHCPMDYVVLIGHLRKFQTSAMLVVDRIDAVKAYSEVLCHRAEVLWAWGCRVGLLREAERLGLLKEKTVLKDQFSHLPALQQDMMRTLKRCMELNPDSSAGISKLEILAGMMFKPVEKDFEKMMQQLIEAGYVMEGDVAARKPPTSK